MSDMISRADAIAAIRKQIGYGDEPWMNGNNSAIFACVATIRAMPAYEVAVKPLEWRRQSVDCEVAETAIGSVAVQNESHALNPNRWGWWMVGSDEDDSPTGYEDGIETAKAAAQADYEASIRSALTDTPAAPVTLAQALEVPEIARLVEALQMISRHKQIGFSGAERPSYEAEIAIAALAALKGGV